MIRKITTAFLGIMLLSYLGVCLAAWAETHQKINASGQTGAAAAEHKANDDMRPVLAVSPREIDMGTMKPDETTFGEFSIKNLTPTTIEWAAACPEGWDSAIARQITGSATSEPTYLYLELNVTERLDIFGDKYKISAFRTTMKMEAAGMDFVCRKDLPAGDHRIPLKITSSGGHRTVFLGFKIHALQEKPSMNLNPQRLDLGSHVSGKIISQKIELTNRGKDMLSWSISASGPKRVRSSALSPMERYISFHNDNLASSGRYVIPEHLKDSLELIGNWSEKNRYPYIKGVTGSIKFRFNGTGLSLFSQSDSPDGLYAVYLNELPVDLPEGLSGEWEKKELRIAKDLPDGPHTVTIVVRQGALELEGVKISGKEIQFGPRGWVTVFPNSGTTMTETDYVNIKVDTSKLTPGLYADVITFKSNAGEEKAEVFLEVMEDASPKIIDVFLYSNKFDYLLTSDPQTEARRLIQNGYVKEGIAFRLFAAQTPGTTPFHRWFHPELKNHYYSTERSGKNLEGYVYEGIIGNIATSKMSRTRELYRWYHPTNKRHYYSTNPKPAKGERKGYRFDGIAGYVR